MWRQQIAPLAPWDLDALHRGAMIIAQNIDTHVSLPFVYAGTDWDWEQRGYHSAILRNPNGNPVTLIYMPRMLAWRTPGGSFWKLWEKRRPPPSGRRNSIGGAAPLPPHTPHRQHCICRAKARI